MIPNCHVLLAEQDPPKPGRFHRMLRHRLLAALITLVSISPLPAESPALLEMENLVAWCVVPFDAAKRGPNARAEMLKTLGFTRLAYDWRDEHIATFDDEVREMKSHGITLTAWWMPAELNNTTRVIIDVIRRNEITPQWWVMLPEPLPGNTDTLEKAQAAAEHLRPLAMEAATLNCKLAIYNHGGWSGEPENQIAIINVLDLPNVGIVYNFHHGHEHIERFPKMFDAMKPHLLALNINGMIEEGDRKNQKILSPGKGDHELEMLRHVIQSGWQGPIGILDHLPETDSKTTLQENLASLELLKKQLE